MKKKLLRLAALVLLLIPITYGLDTLSMLVNVPARPRFSTYTINRFYRINEKFNKFSFEPLPPPIEERCVNAAFPHSGSNPCWYVRRHTMQSIEVN